MNPFSHTDLSISDSLKSVRKSVLIYETIIQISDKAEKCPACGYMLQHSDKEVMAEDKVNERHCEECGIVVPEGTSACPNCGCPITETDITNNASDDLTETDEKKKHKKKSKKKKILIISAIILVILIGAAGIIVNLNSHLSYDSDLRDAVNLMLSGASTAETCGNQIQDVWNNAILEKQDEDTDKFTRPEGRFLDFNDALSNLQNDATFSSSISSLITNQQDVQNVMKRLQNPPDSFEDEYEAVSELYDTYLDLTNMVINITGSLESFSKDFSEVDSELLKDYQAAALYF